MKPVLFAVAALSMSIVLIENAAAQDIEKGATSFRQKCFQCHRVGAGAKNLVGPILNGIVGRPASSIAGFNYSSAQKKAQADGVTWTEENLDAYLLSPRKFMPGNRMAFAGLPNEAERKNVIAYLKSFKDTGEQTTVK